MMLQKAGDGERLKPLILTLVMIAAYCLGAEEASALNRIAGTPVIWISSSLLGAAFLVLKGRWRWLCGAACWTLGSFALTPNNPQPWGMIYNANSLLEAALLAWLCQRAVPNLRLSTIGRLFRLLTLAVLPATILGAVTCALLGVIHHDEPFLRLFGQSLSGKLVGMSVVIPTTLLLIGRQASVWRPPALEAAAVYAGVALLATVPLVTLHAPAIFLIFPVVIVIAFRYGPRVTAISALILNALTVILSVRGWSLPGLQVVSSWIFLPQFVATVFFTSLLTSMVVSHQARLHRLLEHRNRVANTARGRAVRASKAKTDFLATMSHEIRTPMNSIIGFSQLLMRQADLSPRALGYAQMVEKSSGVLLTILDDILDFSKVEAGEIQLSPRPTAIASVAEDVVAITGEAAHVKGLPVRLDIDEASRRGHYLVDDQRLRQILLNLLNNAIKFTKAGEIVLALSVECGEGRDTVRFAVRDTGAGIAPEGLERLFKRFSQVDGSVTRNHGGTGLGLAICKGLVDLMGGQIGVESHLGEGSTFWFELPLSRCEGQTETAAEAAAALEAHVLLVDDNPANRELGRTVLELLGCSVDLACDGEEAVAAAAAARYDAILMDVHMPRMDGLTATRCIRASDGASAKAPIIAMSADVLPEQVENCLRAGMVDNIGKPIRVQTLYEVLARWIGRDSDGQANAA